MTAILTMVGPDGLERTSGLISKDSDATYSWWASIPANPTVGLFGTLLYYGDDPQTLFADYVDIYYNQLNQVTVEIGISSPPTFAIAPFVALEEGTYYFTYRRTGDLHELLCDGEVITSVTQSIANLAIPTHQYLGTDTFGSDTFDNNVFEYREWNVALLDSEIPIERNSSTAVQITNLIVDCPLLNDLLDDSGNGNDWVESNGVVAFTQDPPNTSFFTAIRLPALPATRSDNAHVGGTTFTLYYKFTALSSNQLVMGMFGFGDLVTYQPVCVPFIGPLSAPTSYLFISADNKAFQMQMFAGVRYLFRFTPNGGNPTPAILELSAITAPTLPISTGTIFVNDDVNGHPGVFITPNPGVVNFASPFVNGEGGDNLFSNGVAAFEDFQNDRVQIYDSQFVRISNFSFPGGFTFIRANRANDKFYAINNGPLGPNPPRFISISSTGTPGISQNLPSVGGSVTALSSNNADTIMYWATSTSGGPVRRFTLPAGPSLTDLVTGFAGEIISDMLLLSDDTLIVGFSGVNFTVRHINSAGSFLNTYVLDNPVLPGGTLPRLATANDEPNSFWAWTHDVNGVSRFRNVKVSNGAILTDITLTEFEFGVWQGAETANPNARFGNSFSCPFVTTKVPVPTTNTEIPVPSIVVVDVPQSTGGLYQLVPNKTNDTLWVNFPDTTVDVKIP